jgi:hypothetical protein
LRFGCEVQRTARAIISLFKEAGDRRDLLKQSLILSLFEFIVWVVNAKSRNFISC